MNIIPIAFAFDNNLVMPACVCLSSLMKHAKEDTFYDIFILHSEHEALQHEELDKLPAYYANCKINYKKVGNVFDDAFEIRDITTPAYYRLLIPELIPAYNKVIYSDVDVIFRMDLYELYKTALDDYYIAATRDLGLNLLPDGVHHINTLRGVDVGKYLQSGFIMLNCKKIRDDGLTNQFKELSKEKYKFQDQDILNIACRNNILYLPLNYNMTNYSFQLILQNNNNLRQWFTDNEIAKAHSCSNIHFNGQKPWKGYCVNFDIWWEYYRKSPFFDEKFYYDFFNEKLDEYDRLPLLKRIKILARFFIVGIKN